MATKSARIKRIVKWAVLVLVITVILALTLQNGPSSANLSTTVQEAVANFFKQIGVESDIIDNAWWNDYKMFRRLAHVVEYLLLGIAAALIFKRKRWALVLCAGMSLLDEVVKAFTPGKEFDLIDMCFDLAGYGVALVVIALIEKKRRKTAEKTSW